ncbi:hypothetical protein KY290_029854 [Solanum tuberosum]|uniref:Uncharacterized protein n=1 Tax=Solanum tuberosum TaxID=4113 RepID=A0ABQ7UNV7_SOLTU|nr:hypothetical protein KY284_028718 [Solanum tuberosum]KAH0663806.1 hypothetical protein KY284_028737 [Solanum tuberosum]KAH0667742.1 hypothetical protein KY285_028948 [Solanum tuberosum]KAH0667760.1 hypothetical protein KY285_028966 [Solanum tuberosum]KAH0747143.1 hypothetical protein KY285_008800 [Solanum tuberosum]
MKDPRLASYSFVGLDPIFFFNFENQPTEKSVAQGAAKPNSIKERGLTFPEADSSYSNLAMLMEEEKFSDEMDPQEMSENPQLLRGRTLSRLVDEIFSPF